ncbi:hypothetical protein Glove_149g115 [Diversispora epigaea]|uniref:Uncharacterized protein n=1 Tax=Diversispora epigaea TaxID=1348612 RepID=A0A397IY76_9GLOM|nr:hypothetical protein Glove_149g115 [Diversispora epigaea]
MVGIYKMIRFLLSFGEIELFSVNPFNIAALTDVTSALAPIITQIPMYIGQKPPIEYYNKFMQVFQYGNTLGVAGFNDAVKTRMLLFRLAKRFIPPNLGMVGAIRIESGI